MSEDGNLCPVCKYLYDERVGCGNCGEGIEGLIVEKRNEIKPEDVKCENYVFYYLDPDDGERNCCLLPEYSFCSLWRS